MVSQDSVTGISGEVSGVGIALFRWNALIRCDHQLPSRSDMTVHLDGYVTKGSMGPFDIVTAADTQR